MQTSHQGPPVDKTGGPSPFLHLVRFTTPQRPGIQEVGQYKKKEATVLVEALKDLVATLHNLVNPYKPEMHYMRGPGPKWHAKHHLGGSFPGSADTNSATTKIAPDIQRTKR